MFNSTKSVLLFQPKNYKILVADLFLSGKQLQCLSHKYLGVIINDGNSEADIKTAINEVLR